MRLPPLGCVRQTVHLPHKHVNVFCSGLADDRARFAGLKAAADEAEQQLAQRGARGADFDRDKFERMYVPSVCRESQFISCTSASSLKKTNTACMYELQGECDAIRQGRVTSLIMDTVRMASDEVVKADLLQRNSQLLNQQERQHKLLCLLCRRLAVFVTLESALENERAQMIELNRLAVSARNLCEEILRGSSDRGQSSSNTQASAAAAEELGSRLLHQVLAVDSRHRPSEFTPKRDVIALAERHGAQARHAMGAGAGTSNHCEGEVELCKAAAGALQAMLHNDFQQPELLPPEVRFLLSLFSAYMRPSVLRSFLIGFKDIRSSRSRDRRKIF